jgi:hypothetical protein
MFEVGEKYEIVTGLGDEEGSTVYTVVEWSAPLLKVVDGVPREYIFNTVSPSFVSANRQPPARPSVYPSKS